MPSPDTDALRSCLLVSRRPTGVFKGVLVNELKAVFQDKLQCGAVWQQSFCCPPQKGGNLIGIEVRGLKSEVLSGRKTFCNGVRQAYNPSRSRDCSLCRDKGLV